MLIRAIVTAVHLVFVCCDSVGPASVQESAVKQRVRDVTKLSGIEDDNLYAVFISYVEIYNNYIYDLLEELISDPITGIKFVDSFIWFLFLLRLSESGICSVAIPILSLILCKINKFR